MSSAPQRAPWQQRLQNAWLTRGLLASLLWPLSLLFATLAGLRRLLFRSGWLGTTRLPVPVWVVGNLVVGGAGKTPVVLALCRWLTLQGRTPGIVSRGYGGRATGVQEVTTESAAANVGDEPLLLRLRSHVPVFVGRDRVAAAQALAKLHPEVNIIISDDGLQHLRLHRDCQLIVFDARGAGNGWLLPAGPLREPIPDHVPARSLVLYNCPQASTPLPGCTTTTRLAGAVLWPAWHDGQPANAAALADLATVSQEKPVWAAAGIAQPERFFTMLRQMGMNITPLPLPDHHDFTTLPWPADATDVVVTEKDAVKLRAHDGNTRVWVVPLDLAWGDDMDQALLAALRGSLRHRHQRRLD